MSKPFYLYNPTYTIYDSTGNPVSGGQLVTMQAGTTTLQATYPTLDDAYAGTNANANPLVANAAGIVGPIWSTVALKVIETTSSDISPWSGAYRTIDDVTSLGQVITTQTKTTGTYSVTSAYKDMLTLADTSSGNITFNLLAAATAGDGFVLRIKKTSASNTVTIDPSGSEYIDGSSTSQTITANNGYLELICDGTQWWMRTISIAASTALDGNLSVAGNLSVTGTTTSTGAATLSSATLSSTLGVTGVATFTASTVQNGTANTMPNQACFIAKISTDILNETGDGTNYTIIFDSASVNRGTCLNTSTGVFTAPTTGLYLFTATIMYSSIGAHTTGYAYFSPNNATNFADVQMIWSGSPTNMDDASNFIAMSGATILSLAATDTVRIKTVLSGSTKTVDIKPQTCFAGYFLG